MRVWLRGWSIKGRFQLRPVAGQRREYKPGIRRVEAQLQHAVLQSWSLVGQALRTWALETWGISGLGSLECSGWGVGETYSGRWEPLTTPLC